MSQDLSIVKDEDGFAVIIEQGFKFLLIILGRVRFEQVWAYHVMHHIYLMQQFDDTSNVVSICSSNHLFFPYSLQRYE